MDWMNLLGQVKDAITRHNDPNQPEYPQGNLMGAVENLFFNHFKGGQNPYGDPAPGRGPTRRRVTAGNRL